MYVHPKDGCPEIEEYKGFSVGDIVTKKNHVWSTTLGRIVRIFQPRWDNTPYITVKWLRNGAVGSHDAEDLELYMPRLAWLAHLQKEQS